MFINENWCLLNHLAINIKKTELRYFSCNRNTNRAQFESEYICLIYNHELLYVNSLKYLGNEIDRNLSMKGFLYALYNLVKHKLFLLKRIRPSLTVDAAVSICKSMILSLIDFQQE